MKSLRGTGVALITPFLETGAVDYKALKKVLAHTAKGVDYYVVMGTTGESATVTMDEKAEILSFVKANNRKGLPLVYGIGSNNTRHVIEEIEQTRLAGVDALLSASPYYNKPSQEGIYQHFKAIADASPVPVVLYNVPGRTSSNMTAETTLRLAKHRRIVGVKEASGNLEQCMKIAHNRPDGFLLLSGDDMMTIGLYAIGGDGVISVLANAYPVVFRKMKEQVERKEFVKAASHVFDLLDINGAMYEEGSPVGVKYLMSLMELCGPHVRLPHVEGSPALRKKIEGWYAKSALNI